MNPNIPENVLRELFRGAIKCNHNAIYGNLISGNSIPETTIDERFSRYVEMNMPDEYRSIKIEVEQYE